MSDNNSKKRLLCFPMEIIEREMTGNLVLALEALQNDWQCVLGTKKSIFDNAHNLPPSVIFLKSIMSCEMSNIRRLKDAGHKLVSLDVEGLVYTDMEEFVTVRFCPKTIEEVEKIFFWGETQRNVVAKTYPSQSDKLQTTGSPISDLWQKPKFHALHQENVDSLKNRFGKYIILPSSFGTVNHYMGYEATLDMMKRDNMIIEDKQDEFYDFWINYEAHIFKIFKKFLALLPSLSAAFPDHTIIIRPHPSESHETWKDAAKGLDNIKVVFEGSVSPWLLGADAVLHWGCTTGLEAYLMGRPVVSYNPAIKEDRDKFDHELPQSISIVEYTPENTIETLKRVIANPNTIKKEYPDIAKGHENLKAWIASSDQGAAAEIFKSIQNIDIKPIAMRPVPQEKFSAKEAVWQIFTLISKVKPIFKFFPKTIKHGVETRAYGRQKTKDIDEVQLEKTLQALSKIQNIDNVFVENIGKNLFLLKKKS